MAFHSYAHLIQKLFNAYWFGPPSRVTGTSPWPCVDHSVSRLPPPTNTPSSGSLALRILRSCGLASPATATRRFIMQKARRHGTNAAPTACRRMVSGTISLPSSGCFSPFPHGTGALSVSREYLALPDGPGGFTQDFSCPALLRMPAPAPRLRVRGSHPLRRAVPGPSPRRRARTLPVLLPRARPERTAPGLGSSPFARHYWGNHCCFLFLEVLRCFSSLR